MVQSGIAYAAGQLLAVVAPRTVLVVDAPTDWSLAGPLWELALDDAPVDEILDVLIRRGIRTAPSFAIVRVEVDAVRALVRGSVPVCFERVGEPVRLDATGATTWLEGLISGARRVLVGAVETNTKLPFLVTTGVVLVSGLALPCGPSEQENRRGGPEVAESSSPQEASDSPAGEDSFFSPPVPVSSGSGGSSTGRFAPVAGREPRVVDLTRSESRPPVSSARSYSPASSAPESRDSKAFASKWSGPDRPAGPSGPDLNGHVPAVLDSKPVPEVEAAAPSAFDPPSSYRAPAAFQAPAPSAFQAPSPFAPAVPSDRANDDPGELHDIDDAVLESAAAPTSAREQAYTPASLPESRALESRSEAPPAPEAKVFSFPEADQDSETFSRDVQSDVERSTDNDTDLEADRNARDWESGRNYGPRASTQTDDSLDDLLIEPADDEAPPGPAPTDLPNFEPPAVALALPAALNNGYAPSVPAQPRAFGGAPAAWPPPPAPAVAPEAPAARNDMFAPPPFGTSSNRNNDRQNERNDRQNERPTPVPAPEAEQADSQPPLGELPLRVRGRSLRPEHSAPNESQSDPNEGRLLGGPPAGPPPPAPVRPPAPIRPSAQVPPHSSIPPLRSLNDNRFRSNSDSGEQQDVSVSANRQDAAPANTDRAPDDSSSSGGLLLPAFFRGSRSGGRKGPADPPTPAPTARESSNDSSSGPVPWALNGSNSAAPAAWVPPVRRGLPNQPGFNGGPPAMPGVLRPAGPGEDFNGSMDDEQVERSTEHTPPPGRTPSGGIDVGQAYEPPREPPRLLGVWCDAGHVTSPDNSECRVCGLPVPPQAPILVARPPLGVLIFDNGDRVEVDRPVVLGRDPKEVSSADPEKPVLHAVASATGQVSRTHAEIRADGWDVVLTDLDAMNGTALTLPGASPMAIEPGVPTVITPGGRVDLGGETGFVFEVEG